MEKRIPKTKEEARQYAIEWQQWASEVSMSHMEVMEWEKHFWDIASKFDIVNEFTENGII